MLSGVLTRFEAAVPLFAFLVIGGGCVLPELELEGRPCPCAPGYVCNADSICVPAPDAEADADVPTDTTPPDAGMDTMDAAPIDAGMSDAGTDAPDAGPDETACDDALADALFCESFEMPLTWSPGEEISDGSVVGLAAMSELPTAGAHRGDGALRAVIMTGRGFAELTNEFSAEGVLSGPLHVRAYAYIPSGFDILDLSLVHVGFHRTRFDEESLIGFNVFPGESDPSVAYAGMFVGAGFLMQVRPELVAIPRDAWFCLQLDMVLDSVDGSVSISVDGEPAGDITGIDTTPLNTGFHHVGAGIAFSALEQVPMEVLVDEIAVGLSPLPCDPS